MRWIILLPFFLIFPSTALEIQTNAHLIDGVYYVVKGEVVDVTLLGEENEKVDVSIEYSFSLPSQNGMYYYSQDGFPIPLKAEFEVKAQPVDDLTVEARLWIFSKKLHANATNGVAVVKASVPLPRSYDVEMYGNSTGDVVWIKAKAKASIELEGGKFSISYDTSKLPLGDMTVYANSKLLRVKVVNSLPSPTPTPTPASIYNPTVTPTPENPDIFVNVEVHKGIEAVVENSGSKAGAFYVTLYVNNSLVERVEVEGLESGESKIINFSWMPERDGLYTIRVFADEEDLIDELDEENNEVVLYLDIRRPDIKVDAHALEFGGEVQLKLLISNEGSAASGRFNVTIYLDELPIREIEVDSLPPDEREELNVSLSVGEGNHSIRIVADEKNEVEESNKGNNEVSLSINFSRGIIISPMNPVSGQEVEICVKASNETVSFYVGGELVGKKFGNGIVCVNWTAEPGEFEVKAEGNSCLALGEVKVVLPVVELQVSENTRMGEEIEAFALVKGPNGGIANVPVNWSVEGAKVVESDSETNASGVARIVVKAEDARSINIGVECLGVYAEKDISVDSSLIPGFEALLAAIALAAGLALRRREQ